MVGSHGNIFGSFGVWNQVGICYPVVSSIAVLLLVRTVACLGTAVASSLGLQPPNAKGIDKALAVERQHRFLAFVSRSLTAPRSFLL